MTDKKRAWKVAATIGIAGCLFLLASHYQQLCAKTKKESTKMKKKNKPLQIEEEKAAVAIPAGQIKEKGSYINYSSGESHVWYLDKKGVFYLDHKPFIPNRKNGGFLYNLEFYTNNKEGNLKAAELAKSGELIDVLKVRLMDSVDCSKKTHRFEELGRSRVVDLGLKRKFRITDPTSDAAVATGKILPTFLYTMKTSRVPKPNMLVVELPNDMERYTSILLTENGGPGTMEWEYAASQVYTGLEYPCDGKAYKHSMVFFPKSIRTDVSVSGGFNEKKMKKNRGAAVSRMWMYEILDSPKGLENKANVHQGHPERQIGISYTAPQYLGKEYGHTLSYDPKKDEISKATLSNFFYYMKFVGLNHLEFNIVDGGDNSNVSYYKSRFFSSTRPHIKLIQELFSRAESEGITIIPSLTSISVPVKDRIRQRRMKLTKDSYLIDVKGQIKVGLSMDAFGRLVDPLRPEVQDVFMLILKNIAKASVRYPSVTAIGFRVSGYLGTGFAGWWGRGNAPEESGYSQWDIELFEKETGTEIPFPNDKFSSRFAYKWLKENSWEEWIDWRCLKIKEFWMRARDLVTSFRPGLKLLVKTDLPGEVPGKNIRWAKEGLSPLECLRLHGYDPRLYKDEEGIIIQSTITQGADRTFARWAPYKTNIHAHKTFHYDPRLIGLYETKEVNSTEIWFRYWEEKVPKSAPYHHCFGPSPLKRYFYEPLTHILRTSNVSILTMLGWSKGTIGHSLAMRPFCRAFRALPAIPPKDFKGKVRPKDEKIWIKWFADRLAVLNDNNEPRRIKITIPRPLKPGWKLVDLSSNTVIATGSGKTKKEISIEMDLDIYDLRTLLIVK